ncbi:hypothetical protein JJL56_11220 [Azospirillum sp. YIM DDC1]|uniref:Carbohydrate ABC transporter permease n=1 Tax=Azospirillum aestuarii TaxID=2802052 RepID=A0ABS1HXA4_9PROT|nr:hypothetical protein [Azospirillum aestuarii]MBK4719443.1 hypothetical protein [Azospirillum aestuarii]TWA91819.1 hypothetical protein FBY14_103309 [Azospirillum brasilense]
MSQYNPAVGTTETVSFPPPLTAPAPAKKLRGLPLVALWGGLIAAPWVVLYQAAKLVF